MWRWSLTDVGMADLVKDLDLPVNVGGMWGELGGVLESTGLVLTQVHPGSSSAVKERVRTRDNTGERGRTRENSGEHGRTWEKHSPFFTCLFDHRTRRNPRQVSVEREPSAVLRLCQTFSCRAMERRKEEGGGGLAEGRKVSSVK